MVNVGPASLTQLISLRHTPWFRRIPHTVVCVLMLLFAWLMDATFAQGGDGPVVVRGPYLQNFTPTQVTLRWRTDVPTTSRVDIGIANTPPVTAYQDATPKTEHIAVLTGLTAATRYYYAIGDQTTRFAGGTPDYFFETSPPSGIARPTRIWVLGDGGTGGDGSGRAESVRDGYFAAPGSRRPDVWLMLGDNAYFVGADSDYQRALFDMFPTTLRNTPLWSTLGNHETYTDGIPYFDIFTLPANGEGGGVPSGTESYYSFDYANIHFICLDSMISSRLPGSPMLEWLKADLAATTQKWVVAFWHHPPYSKGSHDSDVELELVEMRQNVLPILESGGVDLVLSGHSHSYERSYLIDGHYGTSNTFDLSMVKDSGAGREDVDNVYGKDPGERGGTVYVVSGTSGQVSGGAVNHPAMCVNLLVLGSLAIDVNGDRMDVKFIGPTGETQDYFTISKEPLIAVTRDNGAASEVGPVSRRVTVSRTRAIDQPIKVNLAAGGTATFGTDYVPFPSSVTLNGGVASASFNLTPISDNLAEGTETAVVSALPVPGFRTHRSLSTAVVPILDPPNDAWRFRMFGENANTPALVNDQADPDGDGVPNILERAMGSDPVQPESVPLQIGPSGEYLSITFPKPLNTDDLTYTVQVSGDLKTWLNGSHYSGAGSVLSNQYTTQVARSGSAPEMITVRDNVPFRSAPTRYIRLQVTRSAP